MSQAGSGETYSIGNAEVQESYVSGRRAREWVPFFLPHLRPGMRLLDCGCGVGSITLDLAEVVAPGDVVGIDLDGGQLEVARTAAARRGLTNVRFEAASIYDLPFPDGSFDAVLAHTLLVHLSEPLRAIRVLRRMLAPGGVACVSDDDWGTAVSSPAGGAWERVLSLLTRVMEHNGASPFYSRHLRGMFVEAGFAQVEGHAITADYHGTHAATSRTAALANLLLGSPAVSALVVDQGWLTAAELAQLREDVVAWGERRDAFASATYCAAVGWAGDAV